MHPIDNSFAFFSLSHLQISILLNVTAYVYLTQDHLDEAALFNFSLLDSFVDPIFYNLAQITRILCLECTSLDELSLLFQAVICVV